MGGGRRLAGLPDHQRRLDQVDRLARRHAPARMEPLAGVFRRDRDGGGIRTDQDRPHHYTRVVSALLRRVALVSAAAAVACNGGAGAAGAGSPPPPVAGVVPVPVRGPAPLRYSPGVTRYLIAQRHHIDNTLPTGDQVQEIGLKTYITTVITG